MKECEAVGSATCEVMPTFEQCGAYIGNKASYATGIGSTEAAAQKAAKAECPECSSSLTAIDGASPLASTGGLSLYRLNLLNPPPVRRRV